VTQVHIEAHDAEHLAEPDLVDKGLQHDSVGLFASVLLSVSSVAPAYALTATLGLTVSEVGVQAPAIFLVGFLPMLLAASAYRELNRVVPDAGTSFTWTVKAFGPHLGWLCGWGLVAAIIIVLSNLAGVASPSSTSSSPSWPAIPTSPPGATASSPTSRPASRSWRSPPSSPIAA
jgi:amino acid transporter